MILFLTCFGTIGDYYKIETILINNNTNNTNNANNTNNHDFG